MGTRGGQTGASTASVARRSRRRFTKPQLEPVSVLEPGQKGSGEDVSPTGKTEGGVEKEGTGQRQRKSRVEGEEKEEGEEKQRWLLPQPPGATLGPRPAQPGTRRHGRPKECDLQAPGPLAPQRGPRPQSPRSRRAPVAPTRVPGAQAGASAPLPPPRDDLRQPSADTKTQRVPRVCPPAPRSAAQSAKAHGAGGPAASRDTLQSRLERPRPARLPVTERVGPGVPRARSKSLYARSLVRSWRSLATSLSNPPQNS